MFLVSLTWEASAYKCEPHFPTLHHLSQRCHPEASSLFAALRKLVLCCCHAADMLPGAPRGWALPPCPGSPGSQAPPPQGEREGGRVTGASAVSGIVRFADSTTVRGGSPRPHGCYCPVTKATAARRPEFCAWPPLLLPGSTFSMCSSPSAYSLASWCVGQRDICWVMYVLLAIDWKRETNRVSSSAIMLRQFQI